MRMYVCMYVYKSVHAGVGTTCEYKNVRVCMHICACKSMHACVSARVCTHICLCKSMHACMHVLVYMHTCIHRTNTCMHACRDRDRDAWVGELAQTSIYVHYIHTYIRTYIHTYVHTYIHTTSQLTLGFFELNLYNAQIAREIMNTPVATQIVVTPMFKNFCSSVCMCVNTCVWCRYVCMCEGKS
jgi:hypothetical protein